MKRVMTVSLCLFAIMAFSFSAFAQSSLIETGTADVSGTPIYEPSDAPVVFLDQAPNQVNGIFSDSNCGLCGTGAQVVADNFVVSTASPTTGITEILYWGGYHPENIPNPTDDFTVILHGDSAGEPGADLYTFTGLQPARATTGVTLFGVDEYLFTFDFSATPMMITSTGTYWIEIFNASTMVTNGFFWETGDLDATNGIAGSAWITTAPGTSPWNLDPATDMAIQINGDDNIGGGGAGLLLIDDDPVAADSVEAWLNVLGKTYTRMTATAALALPTSDWLMYDAVLYHGTTSSGAQLDSTTAYVAAGGNLLVMDNDEGFFYGSSPLYMDYLMAEYVSDGTGGLSTGLDILTGINPDLSVDPFPDESIPYTGAFGTGVPIMKAVSDTTYHGIRGDGGFFRTVLLTWDADYLEGTYSIPIFARVIDWLVDGIVPVELTSFTAAVDQQDVTLNWVTASEMNNQGFEIERNAGYEFEKVGYVAGFGTSSETHTYTYVDNDLNEGTYTYRLKQVDHDGSFEYSDVVEVDISVPDVFSLQQNYPNPFNPSTKINFSLAIDSKVSLKVFDILGQEVANLISTDLVAGSHSVDFNASLLTSGVYFYRMEATGIDGTNFTNVKKMILTK